MNRKAGEGIWETEGEVYKKTSVNSTRLKQKNEDGSKCIRLYYEGYFIYEV